MDYILKSGASGDCYWSDLNNWFVGVDTFIGGSTPPPAPENPATTVWIKTKVGVFDTYMWNGTEWAIANPHPSVLPDMSDDVFIVAIAHANAAIPAVNSVRVCASGEFVGCSAGRLYTTTFPINTVEGLTFAGPYVNIQSALIIGDIFFDSTVVNFSADIIVYGNLYDNTILPSTNCQFGQIFGNVYLKSNAASISGVAHGTCVISGGLDNTLTSINISTYSNCVILSKCEITSFASNIYGELVLGPECVPICRTNVTKLTNIKVANGVISLPTTNQYISPP